jgi:hypothetical protein
MRENTWLLAFWAWLTSLKMMFSSSIHLPANDKILKFMISANQLCANCFDRNLNKTSYKMIYFNWHKLNIVLRIIILIIILFFWGRASLYIPSWPLTCYTTQDSLKLAALLPLPPSTGVTGKRHHTWLKVCFIIYFY